MGGWYIGNVGASFSAPPSGGLFGTEADQGWIAAFRGDDHGIVYSDNDTARDSSASGESWVQPYKLDPLGSSFPIVDRANKIHLPSGSFFLPSLGNQSWCILSDTQIVAPMGDNVNPFAGNNGHGVITRSGDTITATGVQQTYSHGDAFAARVDDTHFMRQAGGPFTPTLDLCSVDSSGNITVDWTTSHGFCQLLGMSSDGKMLAYTGSNWLAISFTSSAFTSEYSQGSGATSPAWLGGGFDTYGSFRDTGDEGWFYDTTGMQAVAWSGSAFAFGAKISITPTIDGGFGANEAAQGAGPSGDWCVVQNHTVDSAHYSLMGTYSQSGTSVAAAAAPAFLFPAGIISGGPAGGLAVHSGRNRAACFLDPGLDGATSPTFGAAIASWVAP